MTAVLLSPLFEQFADSNGSPLVGGLIYSYLAGTLTPQNTYTDATGVTPAANPVVLNSAGRPTGGLWGSGVYKFILKDSLGNTIDTLDNVTALFGSGDMTKAVYDPANIAQQLVGTTAVQTLTNKTLTNPVIAGTLTLPAGTISAAPLLLTSGTNLTTPVAGAIEYDGKVFYATPQQRGIIQTAQEYVLQSNVVGTNVNTAQSPFGLASGFTLSSATIYEFEGMVALSKTAGTTAHVVGTSFTGTAVLANTNYNLSLGSGAAFNSGTNIFYEFIQTAANTAVSGSSAAATWTNTIYMHGFVAVTTGGTFNPQYTNSAAPGGAYTTQIGSFFKVWPVGATGGNINVGTAT